MTALQVVLILMALVFAVFGAILTRRGRRRAQMGQAIADGWAHPSAQAANDPDTVIENNLRGHRIREEGRHMMLNGIRLSLVALALAVAPIVWWAWA